MAKDLRIAIIGDTSSYSRALKSAGRETQTFGSKLSGLGKAAAVSAGAAGIGGLFVTITRGFDEVKQGQLAMAQTNAVIKSTGGIANVTAGHVTNLATSLSKMSGIDDEVVQGGENLLLTFKNIRNEAGKGNKIFDEATKVTLDMSVALGKDLNSAAILVGKALNDPVKGLAALHRVGVTFTKGQQDQIKAMVAAGNTMGAQKLILQELNSEFEGSAKAAGDTLPGQINKLENAFDELAAKGLTQAFDAFEKDLLPALQDFVGVIQTLEPVLKPLVGLFFDTFVVPLKTISALIHGDWSAAWDALRQPVDHAVQIVTGIVGLIPSGVWTAFNNTFQSAFVTPFTTAWTTVANWFNTATGFVTSVAGYIGGLPQKAWTEFTQVFTSVFVTPFKNAFDAVANWFVGPEGFVTKAAGFITSLPSKIGDFGEALKNRIIGFFEGAQIGPWISGKVTEFAAFFTGLPGQVLDFGGALLDRIKGFFDKADIGGWIKGKVDDFAGFFTSLPGKIGDALSDGVKGAVGKLKGWFDDLFGWLPGWAKDILGIHSPSTVFAEIGEHIVGGLIKGLGNMAGALKKKVEDIVGAPIDWATQAIGAVGGALGGEPTGFYQNLASHLLGSFGWGADQFNALFNLWQGESGWNPHAENPSSGAYGIPQALPYSKMPQSAWPERYGGRSDALAQIMWGMGYIKSVYGTPAAAYSAWLARSPHWYAKGGIFNSPSIIGVGEAGPEAVVPLSRGGGFGNTYNINVSGVVGDKREVARAIRDEIARLNRDNAILA